MAGLWMSLGRNAQVRERINGLGVLGAFGLLIICLIYAIGNGVEAPIRRDTAIAEAAGDRLADIQSEFAAARRSELQFVASGNIAHIAIHNLAMNRGAGLLAAVLKTPGLKDETRAGLDILKHAADDYAAQSATATTRQSKVSPQAEDSALPPLQDTAAKAERLILQTRRSDLIDPVVRLRREAQSAVLMPQQPLPEAFTTELADLRQAIASADGLSDAQRTSLGHAIDAYRHDLLAYRDARIAAAKSNDASEQAFETMVVAGEPAQNLVRNQIKLAQGSLRAIRAKTELFLHVAVGLVFMSVLGLSWLLGRSVSVPLSRMAHLTRQLARGAAPSISDTERRDEIGDIARALAAFRDTLVDNRRAMRRIHQLAHYDSLTGLANRTLLQECLENNIERARTQNETFAVLCLDLDGFKAVNDLYGHHAGDILLREVARRLARNVAAVDLPARLGGDEFALVFGSSAAKQDLREFVDRCIPLIAEPVLLPGGARAAVTTSIGIALFPLDGADPETLLRNADTALYRAKLMGKNRTAFFSPDMDWQLREQRALEADLRTALASDQFALVWQPLARTDAAPSIFGFEVLLRWRHPTRGTISPDVFIPMAEASGAIIRIGEWVLEQACLEAATWGETLQIAVNVSPIQAQQGEAFASSVVAILKATGLQPSRLILEVTEGVLIQQADRVLTALVSLQSLGVKIALDDFGTGYSSLATLRAFPFDKIKIDRSFISGLGSEGHDPTIVLAMLSLARELGMPVVAEGVETTLHLDTLRSAGCDEVQGYLIGRPAPIETFARQIGYVMDIAAAA